jgi:hypothetical protein
MNIEDFIKNIEAEFDDIIPGKLKPESNLNEIFDWHDENEKKMIKMLFNEYEVMLSLKDFKNSLTFQDLYNKVLAKAAKR